MNGESGQKSAGPGQPRAHQGRQPPSGDFQLRDGKPPGTSDGIDSGAVRQASSRTEFPVEPADDNTTPNEIQGIQSRLVSRLLRWLLALMKYRRPLLAGLVAVALLGFAYGTFLWFGLVSTKQELAHTEKRLDEAVAMSQSAEERLGRADQALLDAIAGLEESQRIGLARLNELIDQEVNRLSEAAEQQKAALTQEISLADQRLSVEAHNRLVEIREEFSKNLANEYEEIRNREQRLVARLSSQIAAVKYEAQAFRRIFQEARQAIVFIRTEYQVYFNNIGRTETFTSFGTGFFIAENGLGMTAQHVLAPWQYDKQLLMFMEMGIATVLENSPRASFWLFDSVVFEEDGQPPKYLSETAYHTGPGANRAKVLYSAEYEEVIEHLNSPFGVIPVRVPKLGGGDVAVFQLLDFNRGFRFLTLADSAEPQALDEVMVIGYPLSRLQNGVAAPQPSRGRVRRESREVLELDSPIHPGNSGGPVLNLEGEVIGLASAILGSPVYGVAVKATDLRKSLHKVRNTIKTLQQRLTEAGCDPGAVDGILGRRTWLAERCLAEKSAR